MKEKLAYLEAFVVMVLVLTGLTGIAYNLFREGGWIERTLGNLWDYTMKYPLAVLFVIVCSIVLIWWWNRDRLTRGQRNRFAPTIVLYAVMAAGAYFIVHLVLYGTL